ncbi:unnamed protein product, partial [Owenia fusiformis]
SWNITCERCTVCQMSACGGNKAITTLECPENYMIQIIRVKNIAERGCFHYKICDSHIQHPNNTKRLCNDRTKCTFQNMIYEDGQGELCEEYNEEDGSIIWHNTTTQEVCFRCYPIPVPIETTTT